MHEKYIEAGAEFVSKSSPERMVYGISHDCDSYVWQLFNHKHRLGGPALIVPEKNLEEYWVNDINIESWSIENGITLPEASEEDWFFIRMRFGEPTKSKFNPIIMPLIRNLMPGILARDLVGVQPMTGPAAQIFTLRTRYGKQRKKH